jgi:polysaccharide biosynthesis transport protein
MSPRASQPRSRESSRHLTDYLRVIYKRRWTAGLAFVAVFVTGAILTLKTTPVYEATAQLEIVAEGSGRSGSLTRLLEEPTAWYEDEFYRTQYRILESRALAWRAIASLGLNSPAAMTAMVENVGRESRFGRLMAWMASAVGTPERIAPPPADETSAQSAMIDAFARGLTIRPVRNTRLVDVVYRSKDPTLAARAANALAEEYKQQGLKNRVLASKETSDWLSRELEVQKRRVDLSERALQKYKESHDAVSVDDSQNIVVQKLSDLNQKWTSAKTDRWEKEADFKLLLSLQSDPAALETLPQIVGNPYIQTLKTQIESIKQEKARLLQDFFDNTPPLAEVNGRLAAAEANRRTAISNITRAVQNNFEAAKTIEQTLYDALKEQEKEALKLNLKSIEYESLKRNASSDRQLFENLLTRSKETGVAGEFKGSNVRLVDAAEMPRSPVIPRTGRNLMLAFLGGAVLALGLVFGFEYMDSRLKTPDDVKEHLGLPFLGLVPAIRSKGATPVTPLLTADVPAGFSEAMRAIRTSVIFSSADEGSRSVVVTSTAPSEGKTVISTNLAVGLAQAGQRTLLIDADMRRPRVHAVLGVPQEPGLSNVLVGTSRMRATVLPTSVPGLHVLTAGVLPPNPAELLGSPKYLEMLDELGQMYPWIVIDAPPVLAVTDAAVAANRATGVLFVVGAEMTPYRNAKLAIEQLNAARARFVGAVLNRVDVQRHGYYYAPYYRKEYTRVYEKTRTE